MSEDAAARVLQEAEAVVVDAMAADLVQDIRADGNDRTRLLPRVLRRAADLLEEDGG